MRRLIVCALAILGFSGCANYENQFVDKFKAQGKTEEEAYVAYYLSFRSQFAEEVEVDGKKVFVPKQSVLNLSDLRKKLEDSRAVLDQISDYKNERDAAFLDLFNLREEVERDRKVLEAQILRVRLAELHEAFRAMMGIGFHGAAIENGKYDLKRIFWPKDLESAFPFGFDKIDDARDRKVLKEIERESWSSKRMFDRKEQDPLKLEDPNAFIWKSKDESLELVSYKILDSDKPENNQTDYIEGFRVVGGKKEKKPSLKIFFPQGDANGVMALDIDRENELGFGIPDVVESVSVSRIADVWKSNSIIPNLFKDKEKRLIDRPIPKAIQIEIARIGVPPDVWEKAPDANGFTVPFSFKNDIGSNFNVHIKLKDKKSMMEQNFIIEYFTKEWTNGNNRFASSVGAVIEYYKPKPPYDAELGKAEVRVNESTKALHFVLLDGQVQMGEVPLASNKFMEDGPFAIEYTEGQKRWRIEKDSGSATFNKRKQVGFPKDSTGTY